MLRAALSLAGAPTRIGAPPFDLARLRAGVAADHEIADGAHDLSHLDRVAAIGGWIAEELGIDPLPVRIAAYVHEYHRVVEARTGVRPLPVDVANDQVREVLHRFRVPRRWHHDVLCAVDATGRYRISGDDLPAELAQVCPVAAAVHDADNLDAIGVVGLARAVSYGSLLGEPLWEPGAAIRGTYSEGLSSSVLAHCYEKLVHLADEMLTAPGRELARQRLADLLDVMGRLRTELAGAAALPGGPQRSQEWDPRTGFLRLVLDGPRAVEIDCRLTFTAQARVGLWSGRGGRARGGVCYLELSGLPAVAQAAVSAVVGVVTRGGGLRIPVRRRLPDEVTVGPATVELDLVAGRVNAVTLHISGLAPAPTGVGMAAG